jgi:hypothetical protein
MTTATRHTARPRWALAILAAVLAVAVGLVAAGPASAATATTARNAVGALTSAGQVVVGASASISTGQQLGNDPLQRQVVVATGVAAEAGQVSGSGVFARLRALDWADDTGAARTPGYGGRLTSSQAAQMAERVGYRPTNYISRGERVFTNGKTFITQDTTAHTGGLWKMADSVQDLRAGARLGTFDYDLNWIAP